MVHGETSTAKETQDTLVVGVGDQAPHVSKSGRVSHVDGDGVSVAERDLGDQLVKRRPAAKRQFDLSMIRPSARGVTGASTYVWP